MSRQLVSFRFFKIAPEWRRQPRSDRADQAAELASRLSDLDEAVSVRAYSTIGTRGDVDFMLWTVADDLEGISRVASVVSGTSLAGYLTTPHSFLAMTRRSQYVASHHHAGQDGRRTRVRPAGARYLFVYPFVKTHAWYQLPLAERQQVMDEHIRVGHEYPSVKINTTYSFGLDDQEFVVAFETDVPSDFLELVMKLRESASRPYTERDTPIFTCLALPTAELAEAIAG